MRYTIYILGIISCFSAFLTNVNATTYNIKFINNSPYDVKFYELTIPSSQANPKNFLNFITPGTNKIEVKDGTSYTFTTNANTDSIYMVVTQLSQSLVNPIQFDINSANSGNLIISSTTQTPYRIITIKNGSRIITSEKYLF